MVVMGSPYCNENLDQLVKEQQHSDKEEDKEPNKVVVVAQDKVGDMVVEVYIMEGMVADIYTVVVVLEVVVVVVVVGMDICMDTVEDTGMGNLDNKP